MKRTTLLLTLTLFPALASAESPSPWGGDVTGRFPRAETAGDFNKDGRIDRAVGYPNYDDGRGLVGVFLPTDAEGKADPLYHLPAGGSYVSLDGYFDAGHVRRIELADFGIDAVIPNHPDAGLGAALAVGDFDKDGQDDLAIGIPNAQAHGGKGQYDYYVGGGAVAVIWGDELAKGSGTATIITDIHPAIGGGVEAKEYFGAALAGGDVNCDGFEDLVIGVPGQDYRTIADAGRVHVLYGGYTPFQSASSFDQETIGLSSSAGKDDHFGAALAIGRFKRAEGRSMSACRALAIGVPGEKVIDAMGAPVPDAGAVHVLYASYPNPGVKPAGAAGEQFITRSALQPAGVPFSGQKLGATLGRVEAGSLDALWISAPGDKHATCGAALNDPLQGLIYSVPVGLNAKLDPLSSSMRCMQVRPEILETETGRWVEKNDSFGRWYQFIPDGLDLAAAEVLVVVHGTNAIWSFEEDLWFNREELPFTPGFANGGKYGKFAGWVPAAEEKNLVVIIPQFEDWNFGNAKSPELGGYRGLMGRDIRADHWVIDIVERYVRAGLGDPTFYMVGQSAGAQFANRFLLMNPDRLDGVAIMAPQHYTMPGNPTWGESELLQWPQGLGARFTDGASGWHAASFLPDFAKIAQKIHGVDWHLVIGALDVDTDRKTAMLNFRQAMADVYGDYRDICMVPGEGHGGEGVHRHALVRLFPDLPLLRPDVFAGLVCAAQVPADELAP